MQRPGPLDDFSYFGIGILAVTSVLVPIGRRFRTRLASRRADDLILHGKKGIPGVSPDVLSIVERVVDVETEVKAARVDIGKMMVTQSDMVDIVRALNESVRLLDKKNTPNGGNTNNVGDLLQRWAKREGVWNDETAERPHNQRASDTVGSP